MYGKYYSNATATKVYYKNVYLYFIPYEYYMLPEIYGKSHFLFITLNWGSIAKLQ